MFDVNATIQRIRQRFETELLSNPDSYHSIDVDRVRNNDWQIKRFVLFHEHDSNNEDVAFEAVCKALRWKKSYGVHERTDTDFPKEFWQMSGIDICGHDINGHFVHWGRVRTLRHFPETKELTKQFAAHIIERIDWKSCETGYISVVDNAGASFANVNMDLTKFMLNMMEHYPLSLKAIYNVNLPWLLSSLINFIMGFMNEKLRKMVYFVDPDALIDIIDREYIPDYLNGNRNKQILPENVIPLYDKRFNLEEKFIDHFYKTTKMER